ncbi:bifunctional nicotinamide-nucleotide adenylyltransferase/Nudix hydroxylase [Parachitinimonas caeni]|uniref:Bifunctional nicotinamide-nucleotide adenylyltransferase/Nudix hydroxylase n=1 Tax=Parachitinimonas caeni TaxID=3031301 RepID=A0ABT7E170_9NEIS|nr:bifunctional nicotinamide-nucleotide adenylyltransferase/Nudix hydroxylase [Parachitinimonas caeni]MDK2126058.1 bifunctional nicotinamide-nucleotide adenylyltransferase/Nudix hydroxylase [Parachitinimonas caeni]
MLDLVIYIGRFQPFHSGHQQVLDIALRKARHVLVLAGSANKARNIRNPFTANERRAMILECVRPEDRQRVAVSPLGDWLYVEERWLIEVQRLVAEHVQLLGLTDSARIGVIGHLKDASSYYLEMFPQWELVDVPQFQALDATALRSLYFGSTGQGDWMRLAASVPAPVLDFLRSFAGSSFYEHMRREFDFVRDYKAAWQAAPYPPTFVTVDCVVVHSGHVLLVKRAGDPGHGLWALPGGFLDQKETLESAALRELKEETRVKLPLPVLRGAIKAQRMFDHPERSLRGRTLTQAFYLHFPSGELPPVKGGDDAKAARWIPLADLVDMEREFFEDHFEIIQYFLGTN